MTSEEVLEDRLAQAADSESEEEEDEEPPSSTVPTWAEASLALRQVTAYTQAVPDASEDLFIYAAAINDFLMKRAMSAARHRSITDFFLPVAGAPSGPEAATTTNSAMVAASRRVTKKSVQQTLSMALGKVGRAVRQDSLPDDSVSSCPVGTIVSSSPETVLSSSSEEDQSKSVVAAERKDKNAQCQICLQADARACRVCRVCSKQHHHICQVEDEDGKKCDDCFLSLL